MLWFCRIASFPCPRPQTLNISGFHKIQFICQHSLQVFILINQSSIIFTKDCGETLKNPFIIIYEEMPPWSREYCLQYFITPPPHPTRCWKLGGPKRGADPRVHVGGWDKLRQQRGADNNVLATWPRVSITVQKGISGSDVRVRPAVMKQFHQRYCGQTLSESGKETMQTGRGINRAARSDLSPTPLMWGQGRCQERRSLCVRLHTKSLQSSRPLGLSPLILNDPISTGKDGDEVGCGGSPWTNGTVKSLVSHMVNDKRWATALRRSRRKGLMSVIFKTVGVFTVPALLSSTTGGTDLGFFSPNTHSNPNGIKVGEQKADEPSRSHVHPDQLQCRGFFDITIQAS